MLQLSRDGDALTLTLSGALTIYDVAELNNQLPANSLMATSVTLDLAAVTEMDTAGLQWLMALRKAFAERLILQHHSQAVIELFDLYQIAPFFGDAIVISEH